VNVTQAVLPILRKQRSGHLLQISSIGGRLGSPGLSAYQASKFAVEGFSEVTSKEVAHLGIKVTIIEPGGFRTDWAGASMTVKPSHEDYVPSVGQFGKMIASLTGNERGDPHRGAQAMMKITQVEKPPLRLLLGTDASYLANGVLQQRMAEDAEWKSLSHSTDFDGLPDIGEIYASLVKK
jgi:NAD(P)-dependent dehydrogenase (short-subunit alcohol dehydrogenase family)